MKRIYILFLTLLPPVCHAAKESPDKHILKLQTVFNKANPDHIKQLFRDAHADATSRPMFFYNPTRKKPGQDLDDTITLEFNQIREEIQLCDFYKSVVIAMLTPAQRQAWKTYSTHEKIIEKHLNILSPDLLLNWLKVFHKRVHQVIAATVNLTERLNQRVAELGIISPPLMVQVTEGGLMHREYMGRLAILKNFIVPFKFEARVMNPICLHLLMYQTLGPQLYQGKFISSQFKKLHTEFFIGVPELQPLFEKGPSHFGEFFSGLSTRNIKTLQSSRANPERFWASKELLDKFKPWNFDFLAQGAWLSARARYLEGEKDAFKTLRQMSGFFDRIRRIADKQRDMEQVRQVKQWANEAKEKILSYQAKSRQLIAEEEQKHWTFDSSSGEEKEEPVQDAEKTPPVIDGGIRRKFKELKLLKQKVCSRIGKVTPLNFGRTQTLLATLRASVAELEPYYADDSHFKAISNEMVAWNKRLVKQFQKSLNKLLDTSTKVKLSDWQEFLRKVEGLRGCLVKLQGPENALTPGQLRNLGRLEHRSLERVLQQLDQLENQMFELQGKVDQYTLELTGPDHGRLREVRKGVEVLKKWPEQPPMVKVRLLRLESALCGLEAFCQTWRAGLASDYPYDPLLNPDAKSLQGLLYGNHRDVQKAIIDRFKFAERMLKKPNAKLDRLLREADISREQLGHMVMGRAPLGMTPDQYQDFARELEEALHACFARVIGELVQGYMVKEFDPEALQYVGHLIGSSTTFVGMHPFKYEKKLYTFKRERSDYDLVIKAKFIPYYLHDKRDASCRQLARMKYGDVRSEFDNRVLYRKKFFMYLDPFSQIPMVDEKFRPLADFLDRWEALLGREIDLSVYKATEFIFPTEKDWRFSFFGKFEVPVEAEGAETI